MSPNASLMKAGCFALLTVRYPLSALSLNSHLFVSDEAIDDFPGRKFEITAVSSFNKKELRRSLSGIEKANLAVRNFPMSVADLRKRLKIKEGGDIYLLLLLMQKAITCFSFARKQRYQLVTLNNFT